MAKAIDEVPEDVFASETTANSLTKTLRILALLDEAGWLDTALALLSNRDALLSILVDQVGNEGALNIVKHGVSFMEALSRVPQNRLTHISEGFIEGMERVSANQTVGVHGIWDVLKSARDPNIRRTFSAILTIMQSIGEKMNPLNEKV